MSEEIYTNRIVGSAKQSSDFFTDLSLRPKYLKDYIGQDKIKKQISIFIDAAKKRNDALDHVLLSGPPGLGKTTLAAIIANEMETDLKITSGPAIERQGDLASILTNLKRGDVLFIDEIHRLSRNVEEVLYSAMEDFAIDIMVGKGPTAQSIRIDLEPFTLIGATTRSGMLSSPFRDRFGVIAVLDLYDEDQLASIIYRSSQILNTNIDFAACLEIGRRSRGTPRIANRLLKRVRDYAEVMSNGNIDIQISDEALKMLEIDKCGLDNLDRRVIKIIAENFGGGPVGIDTIAASVGEDSSTIEDVVEPFLLQNGYLNRTPKGRVISKKAYEHLNIPYSEVK